MLKIFAVVGTRPNFVKIARLEAVLKKQFIGLEYQLIHTGQHYDYNMSTTFFEQLLIRKPDHFLEVGHLDSANQVALIIQRLSRILTLERPDLLLVPGDVHSTLAAALAANFTNTRLGHIESGLRSFDRSMPEEVNRVITDQLAHIHFVPEQSGIDNLGREMGSAGHAHLVGNTMIDTLIYFQKQIDESKILSELGVVPGEYILWTLHRPSNVDDPDRLLEILKTMQQIGKEKKIFFPVHPRTRKKIAEFGLDKYLDEGKGITMLAPLDYFSFQHLLKKAEAVITDSGGLQEEAGYNRVPCLILRENTEWRANLLEGSSKLISFQDLEDIRHHIDHLKKTMNGTLPLRWNGKATERLVEVIKKEFGG